MTTSKVAVLATSPGAVAGDYRRLLDLASFRDRLDPERETAVHVTLARQHFFPSCSTPPWQLDGVLGALVDAGFAPERLFAWYDGAAGVSLRQGRVLNRHNPVLERYGVKALSYDGSARKTVRPEGSMRTLVGLFPGGFSVPEPLAGCQVIHLSTMKTRLGAAIAGASEAVLDSLLGSASKRARGSESGAIPEILAFERDYCAGTFHVMDAVFAGEGADPRDLDPRETNLILASADPAALDATALTIMGFDPPAAGEFEIAGDDISAIRLGLELKETGGAKFVRALERTTSGTILEPAAALAAYVYYDWFRYLTVGEYRIKRAMSGEWGRVFETYRK